MRRRLGPAALLILLGGCGSGTEGPRCPDVACLERTLSGHAQRVTAVAFSPDSRTLATGSVDFTVKVWTVADGALVRTLSGHASSVMAVAFSPDGTLLASGSEDATVRLWRASDGALVRTLTGPAFGITALAFADDGRSLLASSSDHTVRAWDVASGAERLNLAAHVAPVTALALAPDGRTFATSGSFLDGRVRLWSYPAASEVWQAPFDVAVWSLAFAPDGRTLASGGNFGAVKVRAQASGQEQRTLPTGDLFVPAVAYSPSGSLLAAAQAAGIQVFDPASGSLRGLLSGHTGTVFALAFSRDGLYLASGSDDTTARLWRVS